MTHIFKITHAGGANYALRVSTITFVTGAATTYRIAVTRRDADGVNETVTNYDFTDDGSPTDAEVRAGLVALFAAVDDLTATDPGAGATITLGPKNALIAQNNRGQTYLGAQPVKIAVSVTAGAGTISITQEATIISGLLAGYTAYHLLGVDDYRRALLTFANQSPAVNAIVNFGAAATAANGMPVYASTTREFRSPTQAVNIYAASAITLTGEWTL